MTIKKLKPQMPEATYKADGYTNIFTNPTKEKKPHVYVDELRIHDSCILVNHDQTIVQLSSPPRKSSKVVITKKINF